MAQNNYQTDIKLKFRADVTDLNKGFDSLQKNLQKVYSTGGRLAITEQIREAANVAIQLRQNLGSAFNMDTGRLNFTQFTAQMKQAGLSMQDYINSLNRLGPTGQQAFNQLSQAVLNSEIQLKRAHPILNKFVDSIGRVAMWQISSAAIGAFTSGIREALSFTQDLNESLNNIRIVTKASTDEMAEFAVKANAAAQALSSTTTAYTDASLIYFQQGLSEEEAIKRTNITLKMANITGESVRTISNDLTAIWNNFSDGTNNLEYYVDVMTKLGATTASSSKEIATGLEKFAPIARSVGLSYEYAAAALATVSAETRASADIVGTAFKTIFARLESLKLGETLEDGVGLTKYTAALESIGVSVLDINGEIRRLDDILRDVGAKWQELDTAQKSALANTVAGVRQYSQFYALMENWGKVEMNVDVAFGSTGELEAQQKIYEEGWKGTSQRVKDSLQKIYMDLLNDSNFIEFLNGLNEIIKIINVVLKTLGGIPGILATITNLYLTLKKDIIANSIGKTLEQMWLTSRRGIAEQRKEQQVLFDEMKRQANIRVENVRAATNTEPSKWTKDAANASVEAYDRQSKLQQTILKQGRQLTEEEKNRLNILRQQVQEYSDKSLKGYTSAIKGQQKADFSIQESETAALNRVKDEGIYNMALFNADRYNDTAEEKATLLKQGIAEKIFSEDIQQKLAEIEKEKEAALEAAKSSGKQDRPMLESNAIQIFDKKISDLVKEAQIALENSIVKASSTTLNGNLKKAGDNYQKNVNTVTGLTSINKDVSALIGLNPDAIQKELSVIKDSYEKAFGSDFKDLTDSARQAIQDLFKPDTTADNLEERLKRVQDELAKAKEEAPDLKRKLEEAFNGDSENMKAFIRGVGQAAGSSVSAAKGLQGMAHQTKIFNQETDKLKTQQGFQKIGTDITNAARALASIGQLVSMFKNLSQSWKDAKTAGEKITVVLSALPSLIFSVISITKLFNVEQFKTVYASKLSAISEAQDAAAKTGVGVAASGAIPKIKAFGAALNASLGVIGWIAIALMAVVSAISIISTEIEKYRKEQEKLSDSSKLKRLTESAQEANNQYSELVENSKALTDTVNEYDKLIDKLKSLSSASAEYKETLIEALKVQNELADQSKAYQYLKAHYSELTYKQEDGTVRHYTHSDIFQSNGLLTDEGRKLYTEIEKDINNKIIQSQIFSSVLLNEQEQKKANKKDKVQRIGVDKALVFEEIDYEELGEITPDQVSVRTYSDYSQEEQKAIAQYIADVIQLATGKALDASKDIIDSTTGSLTEEAHNELQHYWALAEEHPDNWTDYIDAILLPQEISNWGKEFIINSISDTYKAYSLYSKIIEDDIEGIERKATLNETILDQAVEQRYSEGLNSYEAAKELYDSIYNEEEQKDTRFDAYAMQMAYATTSQIAKIPKEINDAATEYLYKVGDLAEEEIKHLVVTGDTRTQNAHWTVSDGEGNILKKGDISAGQWLPYSKNYMDNLRANYNQRLQSAVQETIWDEINSILFETKDWRNLNENQLKEFLGEQNIVLSNLYTNDNTESLSIKERGNLFNLNNTLSNKEQASLSLLDPESLKAVSQMVEDSSLVFSNNLEIAAEILNTSVENLNKHLISFLTSQQTVNSGVASLFADNFQGNTQTLTDFLGDKEVTKDFIEDFKLLDYAIQDLDKDGNIIYKIDPTKIAEATQYAQNLMASAISFKDTVNDQDLLRVYGTASSLKEVLEIHKKIIPQIKNSADRTKEKAIYEGQFNKNLQEGLKALGSSEAEWQNLKKQFKDADDLSLYVWLEFKYKNEDLKKAYDAFIESGSIQNSDEENTLAQQLMDIFQVDYQDVSSLLGSDIGKNILKNLWSDNEEEANQAWIDIQHFFEKNHLKAYIDTQLEGSFKNQATELYNEFESLLEEDNTLTWDLFIEGKLQSQDFLKDYIDGVDKTKEGMEAANAQLEGLGLVLEPIYGKTSKIVVKRTVGENGELNVVTENVFEKSDQIVGYKLKALGDGGTIITRFPYGGGGGSKSTPSMYETQQKDASSRYSILENQIAQANKALEEQNKDLEQTWSLDPQEKIEEYENSVNDLIALYDVLIAKIKEYNNQDLSDLKAAIQEFAQQTGQSLALPIDEATGLIDIKKLSDDAVDIMNSVFNGATADAAKDASKTQSLINTLAKQFNDGLQKLLDTQEKQKEIVNKFDIWNIFGKVTDQYDTKMRAINARIEDEERALKKVNKQISDQEKLIGRLYGTDKLEAEKEYLNLLHKQNDELNKGINNLKDKRIETVTTANTLLKSLGLEELSLADIENNEYIKKEAFVELISEEWKKTHDIVNESEDLSKIIEALVKYIEEINGATDEIQDKLDQISENELTEQAKFYEQLVEKLNYNLKLTQNELTLLSYQFSTLSSNLWTMGEAAALFQQQGDEYINMLKSYEEHYNALKGAYDETKISQKDFAEGMQQVFDGIMQNLESIEQLDQTVKAYYGQTLSAATSELQLYTAGITRATTTLNHYLTVLKMIGRETDYESLGKVYEGLIKVSKNDYEISKQWYEEMKAEAETLEQAMNQYDKESKSYEILHQAWADAANAMDQAYSDMLSKMEAWTQAIVDNFENTLQKLHKSLEENLTEGTNFDTVIKHLERLKTAEDEYLTKTNQVYELNKLAREAQKEMDSMSNSVSKQRLNNFIQETNALKDNTKLSNLELEIQRAKYELLLAEMGVEDARATKNKVRLQRDSEGGYGYVYTSDIDELADAQQKFEDAQNKLYNIGLENTENYTDKFYQTMQSYYQEMAELDEAYRTGQISSEELYRQQQEEIMEYYNQRLLNYKELYRIAAKETDDRVLEDSWTSQTQMLDNTDYWSAEMERYSQEVRVEFDQYRKDLTFANEEVGRTAEDVATNVSHVVTESDNLTKEIQNELIPALQSVLGDVINQVTAYAEWRDTVKDLIKHMQQLAIDAQNAMKALAGLNGVQSSGMENDSTDWSYKMAEAARMALNYEVGSDEYNKQIDLVNEYALNREKKINGNYDQYKGEATTSAIYDYVMNATADALEEILYKKHYFKDIEGIDTYATGGYTGEWDDSGRLALLHQKELVLNQEDTQNILSAVRMVRQMDSLLEGFSLGDGMTSPMLQQAVTIHAEFPNVQDHNEIEMALNNLVNRASQFVMV